MADSTFEVRRCRRGHIKRPGASYCHDCHAQTERERYQSNPAAERMRKATSYRADEPTAYEPYVPHENLQKFALSRAKADKRFKRNRPKFAPTVAERREQKERAKAVNFCAHSNATLIETGNYHCPDCDAHINPFTGDIISVETAPASNVPQAVPAEAAAAAKSEPKKRGRKAKEKTTEAPPVPGTELQESVASDDAGAAAPVPAAPPTPPALSGEAEVAPPADAKPRQSRKGASASTISTPGEITAKHTAPGPWHETQKCPIPTCFAKLQKVGDNVVVNGNVTYHYACPNDPGIAVMLQVAKDVIGL